MSAKPYHQGPHLLLFETLPGMLTPPGKPVSGVNHSVSEEIFPAAQPKPALVQPEAVKLPDFAGAATANPPSTKTLRGSQTGCSTLVPSLSLK